jgi:asparagine synthase (glutamine-hydrolysing)
MSAIFGIYYLDGKQVRPELLENMADILKHRGNDGTGIWHDGSIGLGHRMLWTTPESLTEQLPKSFRNGELTITADARIDNRTEILSELGLSRCSNDKPLSDSELILLSYERWGEECPSKLLGDFAFAIWDKSNRSVFCARDHFGVKPFYYFSSPACFIFATELKALFCSEEVSRELNDDTVADYLIGNFENRSDTFYRKVFRLPQASWMRVKGNETKVYSYYSLDPRRETRLSSKKEYSEALKEIFTEAVRCRMRSSMPLGSKLSGGLDSSSIACVARNELADSDKGPLPTFSLVYDRIKECDEREYIETVLAQGGFDPHFTPGDEHTPLSNLSELCWHADRPIIGPGQSSTWQLYKTIQNEGVRVILDGHDGDSAVSHGYKYLDDLASSDRWLRVAIEGRALAPFHSVSKWNVLHGYFQKYRWRPFLKKHPSFKKIEKIRRRLVMYKPSESWSKIDLALRCGLINKEFASRMNLAERHRDALSRSPDSARSSREEHYLLIIAPRQAIGLEECDAISGAFGLETRYPFWDKRLIEYCLSLPGKEKYDRKWNRIVMRRAMENTLPPEVCWRTKKTDFTESIFDGLLHRDSERLRCVLTGCEGIYRYLERRTLQELNRKLGSANVKTDNSGARALVRVSWHVASLFSWFTQVPA